MLKLEKVPLCCIHMEGLLWFALKTIEKNKTESASLYKLLLTQEFPLYRSWFQEGCVLEKVLFFINNKMTVNNNPEKPGDGVQTKTDVIPGVWNNRHCSSEYLVALLFFSLKRFEVKRQLH